MGKEQVIGGVAACRRGVCTNERIQFVEELWLSNKSGAVLEPSGQLKSMQNIVPGPQNKF